MLPNHYILGTALYTLIALTVGCSSLTTQVETQNRVDMTAPASQDAAVTMLIGQLNDPEVGIRVNAADELGRMKERARRAIPALADALGDTHWGVRLSAAMALGDMGASDQKSVNALEKTLRDENLSVRSGAAWAIGRIGEPAKSAIPALEEALSDQSQSGPTRMNAAYALGQMGEAAQKSVPALNKALDDPDDQVQRFSAEALRKIGATEALEAVKAYQESSPPAR